jgi:DNA-binding beta-propeller fold protein YncE
VATSALIRPSYLAFDVDGNLFFSDIQAGTIRRLAAADSTLTTVSGSGVRFYMGDGADARQASFHFPAHIAVDKGSGTVYVSEPFANTVRKVDVGPFGTGLVTPAAGYPVLTDRISSPRIYSSGRISFGNGAPALDAYLHRPFAGAWGKDDDFYFVEVDTSMLRMVEASTGLVRAVAGGAISGYSGDGGPALLALLNGPRGIAVNPSGTKVYICDTANHLVRVIDVGTGIITRVAGTPRVFGTSGLDGPALDATLTSPEYVAARDDGTIFISESSGRILVLDGATGLLTSLTKTSCNLGTPSPIEDARFGSGNIKTLPLALARNNIDLLVLDNGRSTLRLVNFTTRRVTTVAGTLDQSAIPTGTNAFSLGLDPWGNIYTATPCRINLIANTTFTSSTLAGSSTCATGWDGFPNATFNYAGGRIAVSRLSGNIAWLDSADITGTNEGGGQVGVVTTLSTSQIRIWRRSTRITTVS